MSDTASSASRGSIGGSIGDEAELQGHLSLSDRIKIFKNTSFNPEDYIASKCRSMSEKEIKHVCLGLNELKKASAEQMRQSVLANYSAFIRTSKGISDLEGELLSMRNLLSTQAALVHGLAEGIHINTLTAGTEDSKTENLYDEEDELSKLGNWLVEFLENLEVLLAERRVNEAMASIDDGQKIVDEANKKRSLSPSASLSLQTAISEQRQKLADQLAETACQPSMRGAELRSVVLAIKTLGDGPLAHTILLNSHHQRLQRISKSLPSISHGGAYAAALSQLVFSTIAQAASDSLGVFGDEPAYTSELVTWAVKQAESLSLLLKRYVLASAAAAGVLRVVSECVHVCLGHSYLLEYRGLSLAPVLLRQIRPCVDQALNANLKRIEQSCSALAAADDWVLAYLPTSSRLPTVSSFTSISNMAASQPKLTVSANKFNTMVQEFCEDVALLESIQLDAPALDNVLDVFNYYIDLLINALPDSVEQENLEGAGSKLVRMAETEAQQIALLANATLLADELLPRAASKLLSQQQGNKNDDSDKKASDRKQRIREQREWKKRLQRAVDRLRDSFCRSHALELIITEDGDTRLNAFMYTSMEGNAEDREWFPSPVFTVLFSKLTRMASMASDMFVGRERFATVLLMRLTETVILWISDDQNFWEEIEAGQTPLGPLGLQQLYLDLEFVILFASQGRYLSRHLHQVIKNTIARAIDVVAATVDDPESMLPEDEWFAEAAQIAIKMLTGEACFDTADQDMTSPTAKSISSVQSHGSI